MSTADATLPISHAPSLIRQGGSFPDVGWKFLMTKLRAA